MDTDFIPQVSATCKAGHMNIRVSFNNSFSGAIHARDYRTPSCMVHGDGGKVVTLDINLLAQQGAPDYCGLLVNNVSLSRMTRFDLYRAITSLVVQQIILDWVIVKENIAKYVCCVGTNKQCLANFVEIKKPFIANSLF